MQIDWEYMSQYERMRERKGKGRFMRCSTSENLKKTTFTANVSFCLSMFCKYACAYIVTVQVQLDVFEEQRESDESQSNGRSSLAENKTKCI